jgi:hypothetical protein
MLRKGRENWYQNKEEKNTCCAYAAVLLCKCKIKKKRKTYIGTYIADASRRWVSCTSVHEPAPPYVVHLTRNASRVQQPPSCMRAPVTQEAWNHIYRAPARATDRWLRELIWADWSSPRDAPTRYLMLHLLNQIRPRDHHLLGHTCERWICAGFWNLKKS